MPGGIDDARSSVTEASTPLEFIERLKIALKDQDDDFAEDEARVRFLRAVATAAGLEVSEGPPEDETFFVRRRRDSLAFTFVVKQHAHWDVHPDW
jgi:hypothetical protein